MPPQSAQAEKRTLRAAVVPMTENEEAGCLLRRGTLLLVLSLGVLIAGSSSSNAGPSALNTRGFSPKGQILFVTERISGTVGRLYLMNADGSGRRRVPTGTNNPGAATWAPDGRHIAFVSMPSLPNARQALFVMTPNGLHRRLIARESYPPGFTGTLAGISYAWSPNANRLAYSITEAGKPRLYVADLRGGKLVNLTPPETALPTAYYGEVTWSPAGRWVGFLRFEGEEATTGCCSMEYDLVRPDGSGLRRLLHIYEWIHDVPVVSWAPDGARLAVVTEGRHRNDPALAVIATNTARRKRVKGFQPLLMAPTWSPNSSRFVFSDVRPRPGNRLQTRLISLRASGGDPSTLYARMQVALAQWAPDGQRILIVVGPVGKEAWQEIDTIPAEGGNTQVLVRLAHGWGVFSASWRPR
jgi:Tol biopolymer transport system component